MIDPETLHIKVIEIIPTIEIETIQMIETKVIKTIDLWDFSNNRSSYQRSHINNYQNRSRYNSQNRSSNYKNKQRNYSQSPHRNNTRYPDSQQKYRSNTPKHERQFNQVQTTEETQSALPGIDNTKSTDLQLNHINCESRDSESDTESAISINMIHVENDYEPIIYQQPKHSHIYENHAYFLLNYYTRPINNDKTIEQLVEEVTKKDEPVECSRTNHIYQNVPKE